MKIEWKHTVIGGKTKTGDFVAEVDGVIIGRVLKVDGGPSKGKWSWFFQLGHSDFRRGEFNSVEDDKQAAADKVKTAFAKFLDCPPEKGGGRGLTPDQWKPRFNVNQYLKAKGE
jgi:hypothetical protein